MKKTSIPVIALLVWLLLMPNPTAAERRGKEVTVRTLDAREITGELIAVKADSLLLLEKSSGRDFSINVAEISTVKVIRQAKPLKGILYGFIIGFTVGAVYGLINAGTDAKWWVYPAVWGGLFSPFGAVAGLFASHIVATDSAILFKDMPPYYKVQLLKKLRKHARIKDAL
jgi:hypothetical protein